MDVKYYKINANTNNVQNASLNPFADLYFN